MHTLHSLERLYGETVLSEIMLRQCEELRFAHAHKSLISVGWYPLGWIKDIYRVAREVTQSGVDLPRRVGFDSGFNAFSTLYRPIFRALPTRLIFSKATLVFNQVYDTGRVAFAMAGQGAAFIEWADCHGFDENLWNDLLGGGEAALALSGATEPRIRLLGGGGDQNWLKVEVRWK